MRAFFTILTIVAILVITKSNRGEYIQENVKQNPIIEYKGTFINEADGKSYHRFMTVSGVYPKGIYGLSVQYAIEDTGEPIDFFKPDTSYEYGNCRKVYGESIHPEIFPSDINRNQYEIKWYVNEKGVIDIIYITDISGGSRGGTHIYRRGKDGIVRWILH